MSATVGEEYAYKIMINDKNKGALLPFKRVVKVQNISSVRMYSINITDDVALSNIDRYLGDWHNSEAIYYVDPKYPADSLVSRLNLKKYTHSVFFEDDRLWVLLQTRDGRTIKMKDFLWEFFHGVKGKPPRVVVEKVNPFRFNLLDFPEGMVVEGSSGTLRWTPTVEQADAHRITVVVSDGYTKDEQTYEVYANHLPTIVSNPPYIKTSDIKNLSDDVKRFEPKIALDGGTEGLDVIKKVIYKSSTILKKQGMLALEIGYGQYYKVSQILKEQNFKEKLLVKDYKDNVRCILAKIKD